MTQEKITDYYKLMSFVTLIISIVGPMFLIEGTTTEKAGIGLLVNLQFHLAYQFLSRVPFAIYEGVGKENPKAKPLAQKILRFFSWMVMVLAVLGFIDFSIDALKDYSKLMATMIFTAIFLGGYSSKIKFSGN